MGDSSCTHALIAPVDAAGQRLDVFLATWAQSHAAPESLAGTSRARLQKLIEAHAVQVGGMAASGKMRLRGGESITVVLPPPVELGLTPVPMDLTVLYEDADLVVISKPPGLVVHPGAGTHGRATLVHGLLAHCGDLSGIGGVLRPGIVHRLDQGTSGAMVVAKNDYAHEALARQFARREVEKGYVALVLGTPQPAKKILDTWYDRHTVHRRRFTSKATSGRRAVTSYVVRGGRGGLSWLDVRLGTGRTHQIRVHLAEHGHPIVGDPVYGGRNLQRISDLALIDEARILTRQALHAQRLVFTHPRHGGRLALSAPWPADLLRLIAAVMGDIPKAAGA